MPNALTTVQVWFKSGKFGKTAVYINQADFNDKDHMLWADYENQPKKQPEPAKQAPEKPEAKSDKKTAKAKSGD